MIEGEERGKDFLGRHGARPDSPTLVVGERDRPSPLQRLQLNRRRNKNSFDVEDLMTNHTFLAEVETALLPALQRLGFEVVERQENPLAKQPFIMVGRSDLLLKIGIESGQAYADFTSAAAPGDWVNSYHVMRLADPDGDRFGAISQQQELFGRLITFMETHTNSLVEAYRREHFRDTRKKLRAMQDLWLKEKGWK